MASCPICGARTDARLLAQARSVPPPVAEHLTNRSAEWQRTRLACPQCVLHAARAHAYARSAFSLHTRTEPHTTFPYYHPEDENVLGLPERLPDYFTLPASGVGIGFLDSGYYPHPDLCALPPPAATLWERLSPGEMRAAIQTMSPRLLDYIDLSGDRDEQGLLLESLWNGAGVAWHGQMTSVIAAGNGALSEGRYRGYASEASILPIKIGRGDGRVPERDILEGLDWLRNKRRWQRYGIRVLNISVGGDFPQDWRMNPVCRATSALSDEGLLIVAAAGNQPVEELLAPAQTPDALTVGGIDDHNRRMTPGAGAPASNGAAYMPAHAALQDARLSLYPHNFGAVRVQARGGRADATELLRKPEILAPGRYLASPILPVHSVFREMHAIGRLRTTLAGEDSRADALVSHWQRMLRTDGPTSGNLAVDQSDEDERATGEWMGDVWQPLRRRMNAHKWTHARYQHVDGTSVSAAVVSAVAAQIVQANPRLQPAEIKQILCSSAQPVPGFAEDRRGAGIVQPAAAVAMALRAAGGVLAGFPVSGTLLFGDELRKWLDLAKIEAASAQASESMENRQWMYFGLLAPDAAEVWLTGEFNGWQLGTHPLRAAGNGWWHGVVALPRHAHAYRFWVQARDGGERWIADPETMLREESGYGVGHAGMDHSIARSA